MGYVWDMYEKSLGDLPSIVGVSTQDLAEIWGLFPRCYLLSPEQLIHISPFINKHKKAKAPFF